MRSSPFGEDTLARLAPLFREIVNLKRVRPARSHPHSLAERLFRRSWARLLTGADKDDVRAVMRHRVAAALAATRLAGVDATVMREHGLPAEERRAAMQRAFRAAAAPAVDDALAERLEATLLEDAAHSPEADGPVPGPPPFAEMLTRQPRAGVTCPGRERLVLSPPESHADHCASVAVMAALLAPHTRADPAEAFFTGLAHHVHNASLPDAGHAGDVLLGDAKTALTTAARRRTLADLPDALAARIGDALTPIDRSPSGDDATPVSQAFHAADALDRVLEIAWHARTADFTLREALDDMNLVHEGPEQAFQQAILSEAGVVQNEQWSGNGR
jgi:hypothetical protein